ncbi:MAG TPA: hypothetical protein VN032_01235 [Thermoanaerobaculia bacterium]|nr:hypothetical protein [Thermoanaerobaculia bacterium]
MSISRGPLAKVGVRPTERSTACSRRSSRAGLPVQRIAATTFQKKGCAAKPTGSVR